MTDKISNREERPRARKPFQVEDDTPEAIKEKFAERPPRKAGGAHMKGRYPFYTPGREEEQEQDE